MNEKLRKARNDRHWSVDVAAAKIGVSRTTFLRWEHGEQTPHDSTLLLACEAFNMGAEQLGFGDSHCKTGTHLVPVPSTPFPPITIGSSVDIFGVGVQALMLAQYFHGWSFDELRARIEQEMKATDMKQHNDGIISRRQTIKFLASLPVAICGLTLTGDMAHLPAEELLPLYVSGVPACWRLYFDGELAEVSRVLPAYIAQLTLLAQHPAKYQKISASLLSQAHQLQANVVLQAEDFGSSLAHCKEAFVYAQVANDPNLVVASLIRKSNTLFYRQRSTLSTNQEALQYSDSISPLLRSRIYSALAAELASVESQHQEALRYISLAEETFPDHPEDDPGYPYTHTTRYILCLNSMIAHLKMQHATEAWKTITRAETFIPEKVSGRRMEYLKHLVIGSVALGDLEQTCDTFETMITTASVLGSDLWHNELQSTYQLLPEKWKHEKKVKSLAEQSVTR